MQQSLITLDFGNSNPHAGFFAKENGSWKLLEVASLNLFSLKTSAHSISAHNAQLILSEVKPYPQDLLALQSQGYLITRVKDYWRGERFAGMPVQYANTLGEDRLINAFWCYKNLKKPTLIIDAGTYLTMDIVTEKGFQGGYIIPSYPKYLETYKDGENLKEISLAESTDFSLPHSTAQAMSSSYHAFCALADQLITEHQLNTIIITGGKDILWKEWGKNKSCEVIHRPHLIHEALVHWMTTQVEVL